MEKVDMSKECEFLDFEMFACLALEEITQEEYDGWYKNNCGKCIHASDICMYGEEPDCEDK